MFIILYVYNLIYLSLKKNFQAYFDFILCFLFCFLLNNNVLLYFNCTFIYSIDVKGFFNAQRTKNKKGILVWFDKPTYKNIKNKKTLREKENTMTSKKSYTNV